MTDVKNSSETSLAKAEQDEKTNTVTTNQIDASEKGFKKGHRKTSSRDNTQLRIDGDDLDHDHEPKMTASRFGSFVAMAFLWTGSQIPVYLFGGSAVYVYQDIGGADRWTWFVLANLLSLAAVCPFVGSLSDLMGRRYVALLGAVFLVIGMIICSTAHTMNIFIAGMSISGVGAGINELTALAVTSEMAPTSKRGTYVAVLLLAIIPFCPSILWGQLIAGYASWRWIGLLAGGWAALGFFSTLFFYFPPPRVNSTGLTRMEIVKQIDYVGGFLSVSGMLLFMAGLQWGGYQYPWSSAHTLVPLILGFFLTVAFFIWEKYGAKHPMFPARLKQAPLTLAMTLIITFISGANFFSILLFWPTEAYNVYGHDPVQVGVRGIPIGFAILSGACIVLYLLSKFRGHNKHLLIASSVLMTAGCGAMAVGDLHNMYKLWGILILAGVGIGGIVVPASIMTTIICPDDLIATVAALTLAVRVIGGSMGYSIYYNVFVNKFVDKAGEYIGAACVEAGVNSTEAITGVIQLTGAGLLDQIHAMPPFSANETAYNAVVVAGQMAYSEGYKYVYLTSIAFGGLSIIASLFLGDISEFMDDHIAVVM